MTLSRNDLSIAEKKKIKDFADWILQVGDGQIHDMDDLNDSNDTDTSLIQIPEDLIIHSSGNLIASIFFFSFFCNLL